MILTMKKVVLIAMFASVALITSCSLPTKLINSSTSKSVHVATPVAAVFADLNVSETKISYSMMPSKTVVNGGFDNVVNTAVREALLANGNADVLVGLETQVKYDGKGQVESITVTGYPATYTNFRNAGDDYLKTLDVDEASSSKIMKGGSIFGSLKLGK